MFRKIIVAIVKAFMKCWFKIDLVNYERFEKIKTVVVPDEKSVRQYYRHCKFRDYLLFKQ